MGAKSDMGNATLYPAPMATTATRPRRARAAKAGPAQRMRIAREVRLLEVTSLPTAAGHEERVMAWIDGWLDPMRSRLDVRRDDAGNFLIQRKDRDRAAQPLLVTAHLDHPAFIVTGQRGKTVELEFRGGVHDPYFVGTSIEIIDFAGRTAPATITALRADAKPFKRVSATLRGRVHAAPNVGDIARWQLPAPRLVHRAVGAPAADGTPREVRVIETHACDDLAAVAAACCAFDALIRAPWARNIGLLFTVAEEVGFIGAIHAARGTLIPRGARLLCLENSRSFPHDSPIGNGAILRVGDRLSVFDSALTNALSRAFTRHGKTDAGFRWQRKLMVGGACEATAFAAHGFESTCVCLPLGNYHNMSNIDGVVSGARPAIIAPEFVSLDDWHSLIDMLLLAARWHTRDGASTKRARANAAHPDYALMDRIYRRTSHVLGG